MHRTLTCHCRYLLIFISALFTIAPMASHASEQNYHIPSQPLADALLQYAETSGTKVFFSANHTQNRHSTVLNGNYSKEQALGKLLRNSGLTYRRTSADTITVEPASEPHSANSPDNLPMLPLVKVTAKNNNNSSDETTLPKVTVEADADNPYDDPTWQTDPYNTDYVLPKATAGTKTNTPVMETPLNLQVISKQVLKDQQVISLDKALRNVSGVTATNATGGALEQRLFLRGFETNTLFRNGFRMDGGPNAFHNGQQFANVENVEVLKGPAAILYGRVEPGGMVNITTKQPLAAPYYALNQQFGSYDLYRTSIDATGPLTKDDTLLYRVNASFQTNNSFRDLVEGEDVFFAPILKWNISPHTQATLEMEYQHELSSIDQQVLLFDENTKQFKDIPHSRNLLERNPLETDNIFVGFNWSHQFNDDWSIKHQVSFKRRDINSGNLLLPDSFAQGQVNRYALTEHVTNDTVATILDITGHFKTWGLEHTLLFGGDYYRFDFFQDVANSTGDFSSINILNPVRPGTLVNIDPTTRTLANQNTDNYGLYLQDQIKLPYDIHVMGGLRYQYAHTTGDYGPANASLTPDPIQTDDAVTPRVGLLWQPQKWLSLYGNYVENFGANTASIAFGGKLLPPQTAQQWEVGAKAEFFDGRLRATLAYYDLTKQNVATDDIRNRGKTGCEVGCSIAVGEVRSRGPELDIQGEILPGWNAIATYANQDVRISKSNDTTDTNNAFLQGQRLQFVPRNIGSVWTTYEVQQGDFKGFKIGGGVNLQDGVVDGTNKLKSTGYALVGLMTGYSFEVGKTKITAQLNIDNLLDKSYVTNVTPPAGNFSYVSFSTPRTFMGSINIQY